ncbi:hypothetical protein DKX38_029227 [Salix brachista]|uniref:Uncharacterized protein n=1 Tax=Salix brachista TaxID=2182728 RepID=A0A5N5IYL4_9ROSI|nr:hypothetical protein DKX38_029227 [Salix brachista]
MMGTKNIGEGSSMAMISKTPFKLRNLRAIEEAEKDKLHCSHCNGNHHTKDTCFEIHDYPNWFLEKRKQSKARNNKCPVQTKLTENPSNFAAMATSQRNHTETNELRPLDQTTDPSSATGEEQLSNAGEGAELTSIGEGVELSNAEEGMKTSLHTTNNTGKGEKESSSRDNNNEGVEYECNEITPSSPQIHVQD